MLDDWDLWLRVSEVGRAVAAPAVLVAYREHDDDICSGATRRVFAELNVVRARHALRGEVDGIRFTRSVAANQRRAGRRFAAARAYLRGAADFAARGCLCAGSRCRSARARWRFRPDSGHSR